MPFGAFIDLDETQQHIPKKTPADEVDNWLSWLHIAISKLKRYLLSTYHDITKSYIQKYLDEFCYRYNRRFWKRQKPLWLLSQCLMHKPIVLR